MQDEQDLQKQKDQDYFSAQRDADLAKARYDHLMGQSYHNPQSAEKKFAAFDSKHGKPALYDKLEQEGNNPKSRSKFGQRPGGILNSDGFKPGAKDRRQQANISRRELPEAVKNNHQAQERLEAARGARGLGNTTMGAVAPLAFSATLHWAK